jgi:hypothetical protein
MDEALEVAEVIADSELEGAVVWLLRLLGIVAILAGLGLWLLTDAGVLWLPAILLGVGGVLVVAPSVLLLLAELTSSQKAATAPRLATVGVGVRPVCGTGVAAVRPSLKPDAYSVGVCRRSRACSSTR